MKLAIPSQDGARRRSHPRLAFVLVALGVLATPQPASAFRTSRDLPELQGAERVTWDSAVVHYELHETTIPEVSIDRFEEVVAAALSNWSVPACTEVSFVNDGRTARAANPGDGVNTIQWIAEGWQLLGVPSDAPGFTDVQYAKRDGQWRIAEADIYLNAEHHSWTTSAVQGDFRDLLAVMTHEAGHMLGVLHPCEFDGARNAPDCHEGAYSHLTMFPDYDLGQSTLAPDDIDAVCFLYPTGACVENCTEGDPLASAPLGEETLDQGARFGDTCQAPADCRDGLCIADVSDEPVCTQACTPDGGSDCPAGWDCRPVEAAHVCAPKPGGSCSITKRRAAGGTATAWIIVALSAIALSTCRRASRKRATRSWGSQPPTGATEAN